MLNKVAAVIKREYTTRVKTKGFVVSVFLMPMILCALLLLPSLIATMDQKTGGVRRIVVVDETGNIFPELKDRIVQHPTFQQKGDLRYQLTLLTSDAMEDTKSELRRQVSTREIYAYLDIPKNVYQGGRVGYYAKTITHFDVQGALRSLLSEIVRNKRFAESGYSQPEIRRLMRSITFDTFAVTGNDENGSVQIEGKAERTMRRGIVSILIFIQYLFLIIYANSVMQSVLEEKTTRIVEMIVSSIKPYQLLLGKLIGVCSACLTLFAIWAIFAAVVVNNFNRWLDVFGLQAQPSQLIAVALIKASPLDVLVYFFLYFISCFFFYATLYAAVGAICNSNEDAQQLGNLIGILPAIPVVLMVLFLRTPDAPLAIVLSHFPLFSPFLMFMRINMLMPPWWEILLNFSVIAATLFTVTVIIGKMYQVGILMYGKRPTFSELWRWVRY